MQKEIWKDIPDYEGIYQASNKGRIRTCKDKTTSNKLYKERHWKQRIIKPKGQIYATGYRVSLWKNGKPKDWLVARLIAITFLGKSDLTVNHIDGNRFNNKVENLEWISLADNIRHAFKTGLMTNQKKIMITKKETNETKIFISLAEGNRYLKKNHSYLCSCLKRNKFENKEYKWELV